MSPVRTFFIVWFGQLVSFIGSGLSSFALGIHVYQRNGSITEFALTSFAYYLPQFVFSPVAGALIDRWDRRRAMLLADVGAGLSMLLGFGLVIAGEAGAWSLENWQLLGCIALSACFNAFRGPALLATTALLMPGRQLPRANSLLDLASGTGQIVAPALAGVLLVHIHLAGIMLLDVTSFLIAVGSLLVVRFPRPPSSLEGQEGRGSLGREIAVGFRFIAARPALLGLLGFLAIAGLILSMVLVLLTPLALSFTDPGTLGVLMSTSGMGMMIGAVTMSVWGGPRRLMKGVIGFQVLSGAALLMAGLPPDTVLIGAVVFVFLFSVPFVNSCAQTLWQRNVPLDMQGRVFAVRRMVTLALPPAAVLIAGVVAERGFEPWMAAGGALAGTVGRMMGTGPGRGIALLLVLLGALSLLNALFAWWFRPLRRLEQELPDALSAPSELGTETHSASSG